MRLSATIDPSRTLTLQRAFSQEMAARFRRLATNIRKRVNKEDDLALRPRRQFNLNAREWEFLTDPKKAKAFMKWLKEQIDDGVLMPVEFEAGEPWTAKYVESAYKKGLVRAYADSRPVEAGRGGAFYQGGQAAFLTDAFTAGESVSKLALINMRAYDQLKGITADMSAKISRVLTDGLAHGNSPEVVARNLVRVVKNITSRRALVLARTEIMNAHAEGQLDSFELLGIEEIGLQIEMHTAADPCSICAELAAQNPYTIKTARGLIPVHPLCRCSWGPSFAK